MDRGVRAFARVGVIGATVAAALALGAVPAFAHVTVTPSETGAGSYTVLAVSVPHGCDGSPTTKVAVKIPDGINAVTPTVNQGWTPEKVMAPLNPPITDSHGNQLTERVTEVVYTAKTPLAADQRDVFELSMQLPDTPGQTLLFPSVQTCEVGEAAWVQVPAAGQSDEELEYPAPAMTVTAPEGGHGAAAMPAAAAASEAPVADAATTTSAAENTGSAGGSALSWVALVLGALGAALGGAAFLRSGRARSGQS